jgi:putative acetyltransferase
MENTITYRIAVNPADFGQSKNLFTEYAVSLGIDLSFQDFDKELAGIERIYLKPEGGLLLAWIKQQAIGCAGVRRIDEETAELKRMYVQPAFRNLHIGADLLDHSLQLAKELGYKKIRLDTLEDMTKAKKLYKSFGFYEIPAYRFNPLPGAVYLEKIF